MSILVERELIMVVPVMFVAMAFALQRTPSEELETQIDSRTVCQTD